MTLSTPALDAAFDELRAGRLSCICGAQAKKVAHGSGVAPAGLCGRTLCADRLDLDLRTAILKRDVAIRRYVRQLAIGARRVMLDLSCDEDIRDHIVALIREECARFGSAGDSDGAQF